MKKSGLTGANPTDRGKKGTKKSILTDGKGIPLSVIVDGANRHDKKLVIYRETRVF
ncbi:Mobile element protein [Methanosarcina horonobensis HB-1 = JCM 15518]|uniref:Mobile element protein n=1 Tax=Methanosarcina horonobensis HB-1 = JCM 15518 TaxID=1434110 RepID=A0A0E3S9J8_9EURY|nr:Mobile element protein [Methanosarcina horonobensis HB-1 = JCM 15518]